MASPGSVVLHPCSLCCFDLLPAKLVEVSCTLCLAYKMEIVRSVFSIELSWGLPVLLPLAGLLLGCLGSFLNVGAVWASPFTYARVPDLGSSSSLWQSAVSLRIRGSADPSGYRASASFAMESYSCTCYGLVGALGLRLAFCRHGSPCRNFVQAQERWHVSSLPWRRRARRVFLRREFSDRRTWRLFTYYGGRCGYAQPGPEHPEELSQALLIDTTLAPRTHARRITNPEECDGHFFLDETGGPVVLDAMC